MSDRALPVQVGYDELFLVVKLSSSQVDQKKKKLHFLNIRLFSVVCLLHVHTGLHTTVCCFLILVCSQERSLMLF